MSDIIDRTIAREGGFVDHPADPGGATNMGITRRTLSGYLGRPTSLAEIRELDRATARAIYRQRYLEEPGFDGVADPWLREILFDATVLWGADDTIPWLQALAGVTADGIVGPLTLAAVNAAAPGPLGVRFVVTWTRHHADRVQDGLSAPDFIGGWVRRSTQHLLDRKDWEE